MVNNRVIAREWVLNDTRPHGTKLYCTHQRNCQMTT